MLARLVVAVSLSWMSYALAKEPKGSATLRDGSSQERVIIVTEPESKYVHWEWEYLRKHFPGFTFVQHAIIPDSSDATRGYDAFTLMWHGQKKEVWFDITKPFREFTRTHSQ